MTRDRSHVRFSDLRTAAYCPRKLYYQRTIDEYERDLPSDIDEVRELATCYEELLAATDTALAAEPIARSPAAYRDCLVTTRDRLARDRRETTDEQDSSERTDGTADSDHWTRLCEPIDRDRLVTGKDCRGIVHKVLAEPIEPVIVSVGKPPDQGVWEPQSVHAVAAAKALAWEHEIPIERAWVEYPAYGVIRSVELTTRRKARYRRALRTVRELDGPPPRIDNRSKCDSCMFAEKCGVRTRTLRSLLGL